MTRDEFVEYARDRLFGEGAECACELIAEYNNEVAMFGDAGPGAGLRVRELIAEHNSIARQYTRLTGQSVPPLPSMRHPR